LEERDAFGQAAAFILRHRLRLDPESKVTLRFAFGYQPHGKELSFLENIPALGGSELPFVKKKAEYAYFSAPDAPFLSREVPWKAYYLLSSLTWLDYFQTRVSPQGSAYLYLHGFDGAPRDQSLFSLPLVYLQPAAARDNLRLIMGMTRASDGGISYSYHGNGYLEGAIIHQHPSDLDIFFLTAIGEYLAATGDRAFLKEKIPFHPRDGSFPKYVQGDTVLDHIRCAFFHLVDFVQLGPNGLIRIWDGDWSDGIVWESGEKYDPFKSIQAGESIPNTQMAIYALPMMADLIESEDPSMAKQMREFVEKLMEPIRKEFLGRFFSRAWLRDRDDKPVHVNTDRADLEAQPWGVIAASILQEEQKKAILDEVYEKLDQPSPIGPPLIAGGAVWPAISQLMTWAYSLHQPERAWKTLQRQSYHTHAETWPEQWFGIWSGADGFFSKTGEAWDSIATPMTDWPVMNLNQDAMFLLGLLRVVGLRPHKNGLLIQPTGSPARFSFKTPLITLTVEDSQAKGVYNAQRDAEVSLYFAAPQGKKRDDIAIKHSGSSSTETLRGEEAIIGKSFKLKQGESIEYRFSW
jgi:hypothetical protein